MASNAERLIGGHSSNPEALDPSSVEVRFGNPEVDASRLFELFTQPSTIEHLANIPPLPLREHYRTNREFERAYRGRVDEIISWYKNPNLGLLTAETPSGLIVAVATVEKRSDDLAEIGKVVVGEGYRGKGIVDKTIRASSAYIFSEEGLDCRFAEAFVIVGRRDEEIPGHFEPMPGYHIAQNAFRRQGFEARSDREGSTRSWSNELGKFVNRVSQPMELTRRRYKQEFPGDHIKYFPTPRPPKTE